jgi:phosphate starvation-inducible PhoH-like protein
MKKKQTELSLEFDDNQLLARLVGEQNSHLKYLEKQFDVELHLIGNIISIIGSATKVKKAQSIMEELYQKLEDGVDVENGEFEGIVRLKNQREDNRKSSVDFNTDDVKIRLKASDRNILPRSAQQANFIKAMQSHDMVFGIGPAGTGKTYLAVAMGVSMLMSGQVQRLVLTRPAIEAGEKLGFLPGDMKEKVDPYLRPIYDALHDMSHESRIEKLLTSGDIEIAPLAFMRGRTLSNAFVILDEAQNTSAMQMKMFLTRIGEGSKMVITGDATQIDLHPEETSGLIDAQRRLKDVDSIKFIEFDETDVVRHPLVAKIIRAYAKT